MQKATGWIERDENYIPHYRRDYNLPPREKAKKADYAEVFEETPIWTLARVLIMQGLCVSRSISEIIFADHVCRNE